MRKASVERYKRYNISLPDSFDGRMENLKSKTEAASDSEVIRRALRLYEAVVSDEYEVRVRNKATGAEMPVEVF